MRKTIVIAMVLSLGLAGCGYFGEKPAPAPVVEVKPEPAPPPPPPPPPAPLTHMVRKGETVAGIAKKYGVPQSELLKANNLPSAKALRPGKAITIPGKTAPDITMAKPEGKPGQDKEAVQLKEVVEKPVKGSKKDPYGIEAATAQEKGKKGAKIKVDDDATYEKVKVDFHEYARKWLEKSAALSQSTKDRKDISQDGGRYVATYTEILPETMETEVKRVEYPDTPYVGHITYRVRLHQTFGPTPQAAQASKDETVKEENMREIFSFNGAKRVWR